MFPWSKKITKSVTFNPDVADETLLAVVESELAKQPHKTFGDLCKEALWQFLCVPESVRPTLKTVQQEPTAAELKRLLVDFEQRFFIRESKRLEAMEFKLNQLSQQMAQLSLITNQQPNPKPPTSLVPEAEPVTRKPPTPLAPEAEAVSPTPSPVIDDPLLNRLSQVLDDF
jgi:hypothetical protein